LLVKTQAGSSLLVVAVILFDGCATMAAAAENWHVTDLRQEQLRSCLDAVAVLLLEHAEPESAKLEVEQAYLKSCAEVLGRRPRLERDLLAWVVAEEDPVQRRAHRVQSAGQRRASAVRRRERDCGQWRGGIKDGEPGASPQQPGQQEDYQPHSLTHPGMVTAPTFVGRRCPFRRTSQRHGGRSQAVGERAT